MDAWWPKLLEAEFKPALGDEGLRTRSKGCSQIGDARPAARPTAPDFDDGW